MGKLDIHGCVDAVREHFYRADYLRIVYTLPAEAYSLHRQLQYRICDAWNRFDRQDRRMSERECVLLAEAWLMAAADHTRPMYVSAGWTPPCRHCGLGKALHKPHPDNNPGNDPPDRWLCEDGGAYEGNEFPLPQSGQHPRDVD